MDWNRNGKLDASDILTTELFMDELENDKKQRQDGLNDLSENDRKDEQRSR